MDQLANGVVGEAAVEGLDQIVGDEVAHPEAPLDRPIADADLSCGSCPFPSVAPQTAYVLANLPEKVRITWEDHRLYGTELPVHGWHHIQGEIHLLLTLPDGSRGYFPAAGTALFDAQERDRPALILTGDGVRQLRQLMEALRTRTRQRRRSDGQTSK